MGNFQCEIFKLSTKLLYTWHQHYAENTCGSIPRHHAGLSHWSVSLFMQTFSRLGIDTGFMKTMPNSMGKTENTGNTGNSVVEKIIS